VGLRARRFCDVPPLRRALTEKIAMTTKTLTSVSRAVWITGTILSWCLVAVLDLYALSSRWSDMIICFWGRSCDGGDMPFLHQLALATFIIIDFPIYALGLLLPHAESTGAYETWSILLCIGASAWWLVIATVVRSPRTSPRRAAVAVMGVFAMGAVLGAVALRLVMQGAHP
jgi:hypothetical protein